jgi:hypothetical protein
MKKVLYLIFLLASINVFSQSVLTSGGGFSKSQIGSISTSVGQIFSKNVINNKNSLKEGVLQIYKKEGSSLNALSEKKVALYPNPTNSYVNISIPNEMVKKTTFILFDNLGKIIQTGDFNLFENKLDVSQLSKGVYFIDMNYNQQKLIYKIEKK